MDRKNKKWAQKKKETTIKQTEKKTDYFSINFFSFVQLLNKRHALLFGQFLNSVINKTNKNNIEDSWIESVFRSCKRSHKMHKIQRQNIQVTYLKLTRSSRKKKAL